MRRLATLLLPLLRLHTLRWLHRPDDDVPCPKPLDLLQRQGQFVPCRQVLRPQFHGAGEANDGLCVPAKVAQKQTAAPRSGRR